jgi:RNA polymerase sigma-70 factor (ECF subfamily)
MLLQDSRRSARTSPSGEIVLLAEQDRSKWSRAQIDEGLTLVDRALSAEGAAAYSLQAAIAAQHARALTADATDWARIVRLYDALLELDASPIIELNRAAAVAMRDGPDAGLALIDNLLSRGELAGYQFAHSARAELLRRLGRRADAVDAYQRALSLTAQAPERQFLEQRIHECRGAQ